MVKEDTLKTEPFGRSKNLFLCWAVEPTQLKNIPQNGFIFPNFRGENKKYLKRPPSISSFRGFSPSPIWKIWKNVKRGEFHLKIL